MKMDRTWWEWATSTEMWFGEIPIQMRIWNATRWHIRVANHPDIMAHVPYRFRFAYRSEWHDVSVYALPPIHLILRALHWWQEHRYDLERWGLKNGLYQMPEEHMTLDTGRWRWPGDIPAGGRRRVCYEWSRTQQLAWHEGGMAWADNVPEERLCS